MGCDVHCHFEIKLNNKWEHYSKPRIYRNYDLFSKMANVRNDRNNHIKPISLPKGLPDDISVITKFEYNNWRLDAHSMSWFDSDEIKELIEYHNEINRNCKFDFTIEWDYLCGNGWENFKEYRDEYPKEIQDIRLIFWFDN